MAVVAEASDGREVIDSVQKNHPHVVVMDVTMPNLSGIEATRKIKAENSTIKIVALSAHSDRMFVSEMLAAGASAYLLKESSFKDLRTAIRKTMEGQTYLCPKVLNIVVKDYADQLMSNDLHAFRELTARENEVLQLLAEGKSIKEIAYVLSLSVKTVHTHRQRIMEKLNIDNIAGLVKYAIRRGITSTDII